MPTDDTTKAAHAVDNCAYCGHRIIPEAAISERFGERFCSEAHAEQFTDDVRAARIEAAARGAEVASHRPPLPAADRLPTAGQRTWQGSLKRGACWGAPLLLLLAIPLFWSGTALGAAGGSLLGVLAALACPVGMYFMMRAMGTMGHDRAASNEPATPAPVKEDTRA